MISGMGRRRMCVQPQSEHICHCGWTAHGHECTEQLAAAGHRMQILAPSHPGRAGLPAPESQYKVCLVSHDDVFTILHVKGLH